jgi:DNA-binding MarR family transcriptional regulator
MNATNDLQGIEEIQTAIDELKKRAMILDSSSSVSRKLAPKKATPAKPKSKNSAAKKTAAKKTAAKKPAAKKTAAKKTAAKKPAAKKPIAKKPAAKKPAAKKTAAKKPAAKKTAAKKPAAKKTAAKKTAAKKTAAKKTAAKKTAAKKSDSKKSEKTPEEEMEASLSDKEIENFRIEKVDMDKLTNKVCVILAEYESNGMLQNELWKKLKLSNRDGSRLSLKLERMGTITREKILQKNRWTYKLILKKTPISTKSIENAPCLVCPVEQRCTLDGEISPKNCQLIEDWVINSMKKPKSR